jgi:hypothetical protein
MAHYMGAEIMQMDSLALEKIKVVVGNLRK